MSLRLIYGRSGTGKTTFCFNEIKKLIKENKKIYIITPEQFSFTAEQNLMKTVENNSVINAEVLTFERMAHRVINEIGDSQNSNLSECAKAMLLYDILDENKKSLKYLGKTQKNLDIVLRTITELKKHNVTTNMLNEVLSNINDKRLELKIEDICLLLDKYNSIILNNYIDEDDVLTILNKNIDKTSMFKDSIIYIDEFAGFTKQEYLIIEKLLKISKIVNISICTDSIQESNNPESDVFYANKICINKILQIAKNNNIQVEDDIILNKNYRFKNKDLYNLENELYNYKQSILEKCTSINLFLASNPYTEIENVANNIIELVRDKQYDYKDIAIITKEINRYEGLIKAIFGKYQIPVFIDEKQDLSKNSFIKYIIAFLDIFGKSWTTQTMFNYIKSGFIDIKTEEIFTLENYCKNFGIKGIKKYSEEWKIQTNTNYNLEELNNLRKQIVDPLLDFKQNLNNQKTVKDISKSLYEFLIKNNIDKKLNEKVNILEKAGKIDLANIYSNSWNIFMEVLDSLVLVLGDKKISFEKYTELIKIGLSNSSLGKIPATLDEVTVGDVDRSKSSKKKVVFIIGLNDGVFPSNNKSEGFIDDNERIKLKNNGIELAKTIMEQIYDENFNIYKAFTIAEEKLYLSYPSSDAEGKGLRKSILINKIKKIFPKLEEESDITSIKDCIGNKDTTFDLLLTNMRKFLNGEQINDFWFEIFNIYNKDIKYKEKLKKAITGFYYSNIPEKINSKNLEKLYGKTLKTSISKMETYRRCAFSYYIKYGLKLSDKTEFKLESLDTGTFMHEIIDETFNYINENNIKIVELEDTKLEDIIENIINKKLLLNKNYIFNSTPKYIILTTRLKKVIKKSVKYIINTLKNSDFKVYGNEIEFGDGKKYAPIEIRLDNNQRAEIIGKIDRVDIAENEDGKYIRIIDYKSSVKNVDLNEVMAGIQIQLLTYLDAITKEENANPAGVLYFNLIEPIIKTKNRNITDEELENEIRNQFKMNGLILGDVKVVQMMDKSVTSGKSSIIPAYIDKNGDISKSKSSTVNLVEFKKLQKQINNILKEITQEILTGKIEQNPVYISKKKTTPCLYCNYKSICGFNPEWKENNYKYIPNLNKNEILNELGE